MLCVFCILLIAPACGESPEGADAGEVAASAAHSALIAWATSRGIEIRGVDVSTDVVTSDGANVRITAEARDTPSAAWEPMDLVVQVSRNESNGWIVPSTQVIARLVDASRAADSAGTERSAPTFEPTLATTPSMPTPSPTSTPPEIPPPPEGQVVYESDWSGGMGGWIGTPDWEVAGGHLVNDGSRMSLDPWLEAPVQIEPWQSMIVEFGAEVLASEYGSFGLVARAGEAGWLRLGMRWQAPGGEVQQERGTSVVSLGATIRRSTQRSPEEWFASPVDLAPGPHNFRFEFVDGGISMFIDGVEVGEIEDGTFAAGQFLGLWSERTPLEIWYFRVTIV